jgi:carbon dioxide concentrating mechanism protein CcmL
VILAFVAGSVVAEKRSDGLDRPKYLLVQRCDEHGERRPEFHVALDALGAGVGEMVMVSQGSACRQTMDTEDKPVDAMITGIVDTVDRDGETTWRK